MRTKGGFANTTGNPVRRLTDPPFINDCLAPGNNPLQPQKGALVASVRPLDRRLHAMGLRPAGSGLPERAVPLLRLIPWWRLWPRRARYNTLEGSGASILPAVTVGGLDLQPTAPVGQAVFAALLPLCDTEDPVAQWLEWGTGLLVEESYPGMGTLAVVLEHLLQDRSLDERTAAWSTLLRSAFDREGTPRTPGVDQPLALLEAIGRSGIRSLAQGVLPALGHSDLEVVLSALACLVRLGVPNDELPSERLLNQVQTGLVTHVRWALAFLEGGDLDMFTALLRHPGWGERLQAHRLVEALLSRADLQLPPGLTSVASLAELLLTELEHEADPDVIRCLAVPLGLALRQGGESQQAMTLTRAGTLTEPARLTSLLNALLIADLPDGHLANLEKLRPKALTMGADVLHALNRVAMALGSASGTPRDWLEASVVVLLQLGVVRLPKTVQPWFDAPERCPQEAVTAWLLERPAAGLPLTFAAAYLLAHPTFVTVLERIWTEAADKRNAEVLAGVGGLLAGAPEDCGVSPAELRCCLGPRLGGALEESPVMLGQLLGLLMTQEKDVHQSALELLERTSLTGRAIAWACHRALKRQQPRFDARQAFLEGWRPPTVPPTGLELVPTTLRPWFAEQAPPPAHPVRILTALHLPDDRSKRWVQQCLTWDQPEAVRRTFEPLDAATLAAHFFQASSSVLPWARELAGRLAAGVGTRLLDGGQGDEVLQRVLLLAAHDPEAAVRLSARQAAESLGIASQLPPAEPAPAGQPASSDGTPDGPDDVDLEALLRDCDFNGNF